MAVTMTSIRLDTDLADEAVKVLGAKSRTEAVPVALREIVALRRFKDLMKKNAGKLKFGGSDRVMSSSSPRLSSSMTCVRDAVKSASDPFPD